MVDQSLHKMKLSEMDIQETIISLMTFPTRDEQANGLKISRQALYKRLVSHPEISERVTEYSSQANFLISLASLKAVDNLIRLIDSGNPHISLKASCEILDRVGINVKGEKSRTNQDVKVEIVDYKST